MVKSALKGYAILVSVFALGSAAGGGATYAYAQRRHAAVFRDDGRDLEGRRLAALSRRLDLDAAQEQQISVILERDREESRALSHDMIERCGQPLRDHKAKVDAEIREVLRPNQQKRFDRLGEGRRERIWFGGAGRGLR